jgi:hypothetical protein
MVPREQDDLDLGLRGLHAPGDLVAVDARQVRVDEEDRGRSLTDAGERGLTVRGDLEREGLTAQRDLDHLSDGLAVFREDDGGAHDGSLRDKSGLGAGSTRGEGGQGAGRLRAPR